MFYTFTSFTYPADDLQVRPRQRRLRGLPQASEVKFDPADYETKQVFYPSKDGTKVPMFIVHKKGLKLDGKNPTFLTAYGGFNISMQPAFSAAIIVLLENGGVLRPAQPPRRRGIRRDLAQGAACSTRSRTSSTTSSPRPNT